MKNQEYTVVSLFSGCGGLDLGFEESGFEVQLAMDFDQPSVTTYNKNLNPVAIKLDVTSDAFLDELSKIGYCDVVIGGFPCQGFSKSGPKRELDPRNSLYKAMVQAVEVLNPKMFLAENVDGLKQNFNGAYIDRIVSDFSEEGYSVHHKVLNALGFGVAQHRRRIFFVGFKAGYQWEWPEYLYSFAARNGEKNYDLPLLRSAFTEKKQHKTIREAIEDLIDLSAPINNHTIDKFKDKDKLIISKIGEGQKLCNVRFSDSSVYTWDIPEVFGETTPAQQTILMTIAKNRRKKKYGNVPNGNPLSVEVISNLSHQEEVQEELEDLLDKGYLKQVGEKFDLKGAMFCSGLYKRPLWDDASPTVLTNFNNPRYFVHPTQDRPFSVRECARLQGFPDEFTFYGSLSEQYKQIGNAVPPPLSRALAHAIKLSLDKVSNDNGLNSKMGDTDGISRSTSARSKISRAS